MWKEFAENHTGFCVQLNCDELKRCLTPPERKDENLKLMGICYEDTDTPELRFNDLGFAATILQLITRKRRQFSKENEVRLVGYGKEFTNKSLPISQDSIKTVAVGADTRDVNIEKIISILRRQYDNIELLQANPPNGGSIVEFHPIPY